MKETTYSVFLGEVERTTFLDLIVKMNKIYGNFKDREEKEPVYNIENSRVRVYVEIDDAKIEIKSKSQEQIEKTKSNIEEKLNVNLFEVKNGS